MSARVQKLIERGLEFLPALVLLACTAASCGPQKVVSGGPHCGFADPEVTTHMGICNLAAEYYIAHHDWPHSKAQVEDQNKRLIEDARSEIFAEEARDISHFLDRFTSIDFRRRGDALMLRYRFKIDEKMVDQTVTLRPRETADEISHDATAEGYD